MLHTGMGWLSGSDNTPVQSRLISALSLSCCIQGWGGVMFLISILCYFDSHHSCFIYINCSAVAMVLDQERD